MQPTSRPSKHKNPSPASAGLNEGQIAGTVIGVLAAVALIILIYTYVQRLQKSGSQPIPQEDPLTKLDDSDRL
jgi:hypothetical protein